MSSGLFSIMGMLGSSILWVWPTLGASAFDSYFNATQWNLLQKISYPDHQITIKIKYRVFGVRLLSSAPLCAYLTEWLGLSPKPLPCCCHSLLKFHEYVAIPNYTKFDTALPLLLSDAPAKYEIDPTDSSWDIRGTNKQSRDFWPYFFFCLSYFGLKVSISGPLLLCFWSLSL